jgi:hypothetical protein
MTRFSRLPSHLRGANSRVARLFICIPKIIILVNVSGGPWNRKHWYMLLPLGIFEIIGCVFFRFGMLYHEKLATMANSTTSWPFLLKNTQSPLRVTYVKVKTNRRPYVRIRSHGPQVLLCKQDDATKPRNLF